MSAATTLTTTRKLAPLSRPLQTAMERCRKDFDRTMDDFDFCEVCPLLYHCHEQEHEKWPTAADRSKA